MISLSHKCLLTHSFYFRPHRHPNIPHKKSKNLRPASLFFLPPFQPSMFSLPLLIPKTLPIFHKLLDTTLLQQKPYSTLLTTQSLTTILTRSISLTVLDGNADLYDPVNRRRRDLAWRIVDREMLLLLLWCWCLRGCGI